MKIKEIANNIELHKTEDGLALMANNKVLLQGLQILEPLPMDWSQ